MDDCFYTIGSYNCRGYNVGKRDYVNSLLCGVDVLCLQEHWLSDTQMALIGAINDSFAYSGVSGFDNSEISHGRMADLMEVVLLCGDKTLVSAAQLQFVPCQTAQTINHAHGSEGLGYCSCRLLRQATGYRHAGYATAAMFTLNAGLVLVP